MSRLYRDSKVREAIRNRVDSETYHAIMNDLQGEILDSIPIDWIEHRFRIAVSERAAQAVLDDLVSKYRTEAIEKYGGINQC